MGAVVFDLARLAWGRDAAPSLFEERSSLGLDLWIRSSSGKTMERPTVTSTRYQALDAWRGIVCLIVVLEHAGVALWNQVDHGIAGFDGFLRHGIVTVLCLNLGAPLFFVISGYCIASSLDSSRRK